MKCLVGGIIYHAMSLHPVSISKHLSFKCVDFSEMYICKQLQVSVNYIYEHTEGLNPTVSREAVLVFKDPYLVLNNNIYKELKLQLKMK